MLFCLFFASKELPSSCFSHMHASFVCLPVPQKNITFPDLFIIIIIIIMYIYHAFINALSAHMIHVDLNTIFCTCVEHSPTVLYMEMHARMHSHTHTHTHTHTHIMTSRNWVLILVRVEILWEEDGFQFGFKRWQGWAVSKVLWEWIPNVGSKAREGAEAMSPAFVLLDFQHAGVRRRA